MDLAQTLSFNPFLLLHVSPDSRVYFHTSLRFITCNKIRIFQIELQATKRLEVLLFCSLDLRAQSKRETERAKKKERNGGVLGKGKASKGGGAASDGQAGISPLKPIPKLLKMQKAAPDSERQITAGEASRANKT